jgi:hypothetical protein
VAIQERADLDPLEPEFFLQLATERRLWVFVDLDLASGEFPEAPVVFVRGALAHEHQATPLEDRGDDFHGPGVACPPREGKGGRGGQSSASTKRSRAGGMQST